MECRCGGGKYTRDGIKFVRSVTWLLTTIENYLLIVTYTRVTQYLYINDYFIHPCFKGIYYLIRFLVLIRSALRVFTCVTMHSGLSIGKIRKAYMKDKVSEIKRLPYGVKCVEKSGAYKSSPLEYVLYHLTTVGNQLLGHWRW